MKDRIIIFFSDVAIVRLDVQRRLHLRCRSLTTSANVLQARWLFELVLESNVNSSHINKMSRLSQPIRSFVYWVWKRSKTEYQLFSSEDIWFALFSLYVRRTSFSFVFLDRQQPFHHKQLRYFRKKLHCIWKMKTKKGLSGRSACDSVASAKISATKDCTSGCDASLFRGTAVGARWEFCTTCTATRVTVIRYSLCNEWRKDCTSGLPADDTFTARVSRIVNVVVVVGEVVVIVVVIIRVLGRRGCDSERPWGFCPAGRALAARCTSPCHTVSSYSGRPLSPATNDWAHRLHKQHLFIYNNSCDSNLFTATTVGIKWGFCAT